MANGICKIDGCVKPRHGQGLCNTHYARYLRTGDPSDAALRINRLSALHRFMAKVALPDDPDDCWLWTAGRHGEPRADYGAFSLNGEGLLAHRVAYEWFVGPIPKGMEIDHTCFTQRCVNPRHLRVVTVKLNQENRSGPTRQSKSGIRGVSWTAANGWVVHVKHNGANHYGGSFYDLHEAETAAIALRNQLFTHNNADRRIAGAQT
jgi:hypothetical protein